MKIISKELYKEKLIECINSEYGGVNSLKPGYTMNDGELINHMYKELARICNPAPNEVNQLIEMNREMFKVCRNEIVP